MASITDAGTTAEQYPIYTGFWTNWSRGRIMGATLTLKQADANLIIAFIAFFIAFVSARFWRILCFVLHRLYSTSDPQGTIYHQCQVILRNCSSPEEGVRLIIQLLWASHSQKRFRAIFAAVTAILCIATFTTAGIFSSLISTSFGSEVLLKSANCGYMLYPKASDAGRSTADGYLAEQVNNAANYARRCYSNNSAGYLGCGNFVRNKLTFSVDTRASCPFQNEVCRKSSTNLRLDTGYIDSHGDFGLNTPPDQRIQWRNVLHCAPLATDGFKGSQNSTSLGNLTFYDYGPVISSTINHTYVAQSVEAQYAPLLSPDMYITSAYYRLDVLSAPMENNTVYLAAANFIPIRSVLREDADIWLIFLSGNGITFDEPVEDEWYRTSETPLEIIVSTPDGSYTMPVYLPAEPASPLGCAEQHQFCRTTSNTRQCGPMASMRDAIAGIAPFFESSYANLVNNTATTPHEALFLYSAHGLLMNSRFIGYLIAQLNQEALQLIEGNTEMLRSNQWQLDVTKWFEIANAAMQAGYIDTAYGPTDPDLLQWHVNYTAPELQTLCNSQKIRSTAYASLSVFGLYFTLILGLLIIMTSYLLEPLAGFLFKRKRYNRYAHLEWTTNGTLQLQRLAHEAIGFGVWSRCTNLVPATEADELLGCLDITDMEHPVLHQNCSANPAQSVDQRAELKPEDDNIQAADYLGATSDSNLEGSDGHQSLGPPDQVGSFDTMDEWPIRSTEVSAELSPATEEHVEPDPGGDSPSAQHPR